MPKTIEFIVSFTRPRFALVSDMRGYIEDSVKACCGGLHPDEPMHELDRDSVKVRSVRKPKKATR